MTQVSSADVAQQVTSAVAGYLGLDPAQLAPETVLADLGVTSTDAISIIFAVEDACGVSIPADRYADIRTLGDIVAGIESLVAARDTERA